VTQGLHRRRQIVHFDREPVPASRLRERAIGHCLPAAWPGARLAQNQAQVAARQHGKRRSGVHLLLESEMVAVDGQQPW
jgi:hypothetical protein